MMINNAVTACDLCQLRKDMAGDQDRDSVLLIEFQQELSHLGNPHRIKSVDRLIQHQ
ncbi:hypothetical protein D3C72_2395370 [compost metagenome]